MIRAGLAVLAGAMMAACVAAQSQSNPPQSQSNPPATPQATQPNAPPQSAANPAIPNGPAVTVELSGSVDSKKAKVGDKVEARTTEALKNGNDVIVPKGTKLVGHVTQATARAKGDSDSSLAIQFDKATPKKEAEVPLVTMILAVAPPVQENVGGGAPSPGSPTANTNTSQQSSPMGASRPPQNQSTENYPATGAGDSTASSTPAALPANSRGIYGLKDLKLMMTRPENGAPTTVITSTGKDVRLDSGTRLLLVSTGAAPASSAPSGQ
jgi:hypothetical protein